MLEDFIKTDKKKILNYIRLKWPGYNEFANDIFNDICIIFLTLPNNKKEDILENNKLNHFFIATVNNSLSKTGRLYNIYMKPTSFEWEEYDEYDSSLDGLCEIVSGFTHTKLEPWDRLLWQDYASGMSLREISHKYSICYPWCCTTLKRIRLKIKKLLI